MDPQVPPPQPTPQPPAPPPSSAYKPSDIYPEPKQSYDPTKPAPPPAPTKDSENLKGDRLSAGVIVIAIFTILGSLDQLGRGQNYTNIPGLYAVSKIWAVLTLAVALGLFLRREWARKGMRAVLLVSVLIMIALIVDLVRVQGLLHKDQAKFESATQSLQTKEQLSAGQQQSLNNLSANLATQQSSVDNTFTFLYFTYGATIVVYLICFYYLGEEQIKSEFS